MWQKLPWLLILVVGLIILLMGGAAVWLLQQEAANSNQDRPANSLLDERAERSCGLPSAETVAAQETVAVSSAGFEPAEVAIRVGQTVRWVNNDSSPHRVAIDPHPLHNECIGLDSKDLDPNASFGFTFTKPGEWNLHDDKQLSSRSKVIVTE